MVLKTTFAALIALTVASCSAPAVADTVLAQADDTVRPMYLAGICMTRSRIEQWVAETGEVEAATGFGFVEELTTGTFPEGIHTLWINPDTRTYSLSIEFADGVNCLLTAGQNFQPATVEPKGTPM